MVFVKSLTDNHHEIFLNSDTRFILYVLSSQRILECLLQTVVDTWLEWEIFQYPLIFYIQLYGFKHMVKHHSDSERGNPLPPLGLLFPISRKVFFICIIPDRITHTTAFVIPVIEHWLEQ